MGLTPQLRMLKPCLAGLPPMELPAGFRLRSYEPGDWAHWDRILEGSFGGEPGRFSFDRMMRRDAAFRPERVLFVVAGETPVATASAWRVPGLMPDTGTVHFVGVLPEYQGHRLGYWVTLATLQRMAAEGLRQATLTTDDFRLPAVKTYLRLGFEPVLVHENQRERWPKVFADLGMPECTQRYAAVLSGPVWEPPRSVPGAAEVGRQVVRRWRHHADRPLGRFFPGEGADSGDESLYRASELGRAGANVREVAAGSECPFEVWFDVGAGGLGAGSEICFQASGRVFWGAGLQGGGPAAPDGAELGYAGAACLSLRLPGAPSSEPGATEAGGGAAPAGWVSVVVEAGRLAPGERVTLAFGVRAGWRWTCRAGRAEIRVVLSPGRGEPVQRLPEPVVIRVCPGPAARVEAVVPASALPGRSVAALVQVTDVFGNLAACDGLAEIRLGRRTQTVPVRAGEGRAEVRVGRSAPASCRVWVPHVSAGQSNRLIPGGVAGRHLFFGDLGFRGLGEPGEGGLCAGYRQARDRRRLDFAVALPADGNAWLDNERWALHKQAAEGWLDEGRFVTLLGYEWRHSHYGSKGVCYLGGDQPYLPVDDARYAQPAGLYEALRGSDALVVGYGSGGGREAGRQWPAWTTVETDVERLAELEPPAGLREGDAVSGEALFDSGRGAGVLEALRGGLRLALVGGTGADCAPPSAVGWCDGSPPVGLCGVWATDLSRRALFGALRARCTYAVFGRRAVLWYTVNGAPMGAELPLAERVQVRVQAWAEVAIARLEIWRCGVPWRTLQAGRRTCVDVTEGDGAGQPAFYHVCIVLADGSLAVGSPVWVG